MRFAVLISTGGAVLNESLKFDFFRKNLTAVYSDRVCDGMSVAQKYNIKNSVLEFTDNLEFSNELLKNLKKDRIDFIFLFYTKLLGGDLLSEYKYKIINLHPSLLPAFKGINVINKSLYSRVSFLGTTIHFIDEKIDSGFCIIQSVIPRYPIHTHDQVRHTIFLHQCKTFLQVVRWLLDGRLRIVDGSPMFFGVEYRSREFIPSLDRDIALSIG